MRIGLDGQCYGDTYNHLAKSDGRENAVKVKRERAAPFKIIASLFWRKGEKAKNIKIYFVTEVLSRKIFFSEEKVHHLKIHLKILEHLIVDNTLYYTVIFLVKIHFLCKKKFRKTHMFLM